jgi:hypothetical protein
MTNGQAQDLATKIARESNARSLDQAGLVAWCESQDGMGACDYDDDGVMLFLGADNEHQPVLFRDPQAGWVVTHL